jgi:transposase InsO family protein
MEGKHEFNISKMLKTFDGTAQAWPDFRKTLCKVLTVQEMLYIIERADDELESVQGSTIKVEGSSSSDLDDDDPPDELAETAKKESTTVKKEPAVAKKESAAAKKLRTQQARNRLKNDCAVTVYLENKIEPNTWTSIKDLPTAYEMIKTLDELYGKETTNSYISRWNLLLDVKYVPEEQNWADHVASIKRILSLLKQSGNLSWEKMEKMIYLRSVPQNLKWNSVITSLQTIDSDNLTVEKVISTLREFDERNPVSKTKVKPSSSETAFIVDEGKKRRPFKRFAKPKSPKDSNLDKCDICGWTGAHHKSCSKRKSNQSGESSQKESSNKETVHHSWAAGRGKGRMNPDSWFEDSGASQLFTNRRDVFHTWEDIDEDVQVGDDFYIHASGKGLVKFESTLSTGKTINIEFKSFYYCKDLVGNLMSMTLLENKGFTTNSGGGTKYYHWKDEEVMCAKIIDGKYEFQLKVKLPERQILCALAATSSPNVDLWHKRLCHLGFDNIKRLSTMVDGMKLDGKPSAICDDCNRSKITRRPFKSSDSPRAKHALDLLHMDFLVMNIPTRNDEKYALIMTDDCSALKTVLFFKERSGEAILQKWLPWLTWAERACGRSLKCVRTDNALEFKVGDFKAKLTQLGIEHQTTVPYEHEQNGMAERANRTILDKTRSVLVATFSDTNKQFWSDAMQCAVYCANRSPVSDLDITPWEAFTGRKPDISNLRIFGSRCWARLPAEKLRGSHKLDQRSRICRFLHYTNGGHAYMVLDVESGDVFETTNVIFDETDYVVTHYSSDYIDDIAGIPVSPAADPVEINDVDASGGVTSDITRTGGSTIAVPPPTTAAPPPISATTQNSSDDSSQSTDNSDAEEPDEPWVDPSTKFHSSAKSTEMAELRRSSRIPQPRRDDLFKLKIRADAHFAYFTEGKLDPKEVQAARAKEIATLEEYGTWELQALPKGRKALKCRFVDTQKSDSDGNPGDYKSRLVVKGYTMVKGIDFHETFAPVTKVATIRAALSIANHKGLLINQFDVKSAFVNAYMDQVTYMEQPPGFEKYPTHLKGDRPVVCKLIKALYGTKQAARLWNLMWNETMVGMGFNVSIWDKCLYSRGSWTKKNIHWILVWTDDVLSLTYPSFAAEHEGFMKKISDIFQLKQLGQVKRYIGMQIARDMTKGEMSISQAPALKDLLTEYGFEQEKNKAVPIPAGKVLEKATETEIKATIDYRSIVGSLNYVVMFSRPDLAHAVGQFSRFCSNPSLDHEKALLQCMKYVSANCELALVYRKFHKEIMEHYAYADSNFVTDMDSAKSTYGYVTYLGNDAVQWKSKLSRNVATSTVMAELEGAYHCLCQCLWEDGLYKSLGITDGPFTIYLDNESVLNVLNSEKQLDRTKHEAVRVEFMREKVKRGIVTFKKVSSESNIADVLTKSLTRVKFLDHIASLGMG